MAATWVCYVQVAALSADTSQTVVALTSSQDFSFSTSGADQYRLHSLPAEGSYIAAIHTKAPIPAPPLSPIEVRLHPWECPAAPDVFASGSQGSASGPGSTQAACMSACMCKSGRDYCKQHVKALPFAESLIIILCFRCMQAVAYQRYAADSFDSPGTASGQDPGVKPRAAGLSKYPAAMHGQPELQGQCPQAAPAQSSHVCCITLELALACSTGQA